MKKFILSYYPFFLGFLLFSLIGFILGCHSSNTLFNENTSFTIIMLVLVFLCVFAVLAEMIGFMIHAIKNKDLKNKVFWCVCIYLFNAMLVPYYNLKYVMKDKNTNNKIIIYAVVLILFTFGAYFYADYQVTNTPVTLVTKDNYVSCKMRGTYVQEEHNEYDLYAFDYKNDAVLGMFSYDFDEYQYNLDYYFDKQINYFSRTRSKFKYIDEQYFSNDEFMSLTKFYVGKNNGRINYYAFTKLEFNDSNKDLIIIQTSIGKDYNKNKEIFMDNIKNISVNKK